MIEAHLLTAYRNTTYRVFFTGEQVDIRIGCRHPRLDQLLGRQSWAFITADNPASIVAGDNAAHRLQLAERLSNHDCHPGLGLPDAGDWPPEESLLVAGMQESEARQVGLEFGQHAVLCGDAGMPARLVLVSDQAL